MSMPKAKPSKKKRTYSYLNKQYYCEWNPRVINVIKQMSHKGDTNRILKIKLVGGGDQSLKVVSGKTKRKRLGPLAKCFKERKDPLEFCTKTINFQIHNKKDPIPIKKFQEWLDYAKFYYGEAVIGTITVEYLIWLDNYNHPNWNDLHNPNKIRWAAFMTRDEIKLTGDYRKAIPDLEESGVYRPLVIRNAMRFNLHWNKLGRISSKEWESADLVRGEDISPSFPNLWVDRGDIEFFEVDPKTKKAIVKEFPKKIRTNGEIKEFDT